jgi:predicted NBD/HSP70 family sugar kinase
MPESWNWEAFGPLTEEWLDAAARAIAIAIINAHAMLESDLAIVDSAVPDTIRERLVIKVRERLANKPTLTSEHPPVLQGNLGGRAPAMGAALMPMYRRYFSRDAADMGL